MRSQFKLVILMVLLLMFFAVDGRAKVSASSEIDAKSAIDAADSKIIDSYLAIVDTEEVGANITVLLHNLTTAGELLTQAIIAYDEGDFDSAYNLATQSQEELDGFTEKAVALKETTVHEINWDFTVNVVGSIVGAVTIVCGSFIIWFVLKRRFEEVGGDNH